MHRREFLLSATGIVGATTVGSIAYTSATVTRGVTAEVSQDSKAIIELKSGNTNAVTTTSNGELKINPDSGSGLNANATFKYGDSGNISTDNAFTITNADSSKHSLTLKLNNMSLPGSSSFSIELFNGSGSLGTVTPSSDLSIGESKWGSSTTLYALVSVTTDGTADGDKLSGDLVLDAN